MYDRKQNAKGVWLTAAMLPKKGRVRARKVDDSSSAQRAPRWLEQRWAAPIVVPGSVHEGRGKASNFCRVIYAREVRLWHLADIEAVPLDVRFWAPFGHPAEDAHTETRSTFEADAHFGSLRRWDTARPIRDKKLPTNRSDGPKHHGKNKPRSDWVPIGCHTTDFAWALTALSLRAPVIRQCIIVFSSSTYLSKTGGVGSPSANPSLSACFPVPSEDTGKFADFGLKLPRHLGFREEIQLFANRIPWLPNRENFRANKEHQGAAFARTPPTPT